MLSKLRTHAVVAACFFFLTLAQQYLFYWLKAIPIIPFAPGKYLGVYAFFLVMTFIKQPRLRLGALSFIFLINFFQMAHISYYGTQLLPGELYLVFSQFHEIQGTLKEELSHITVPLVMTVAPFLLGLLIHRRLEPQIQLRYLGVLFLGYLIYNPARTYLTGNTWGRQPSTRELTGMNVYLSTSYFLGKILPYKLLSPTQGQSNSSLEVRFVAPKKPTWDKIVVVLGESLTPNHMSLYGYKLPTTPFLDSLKGGPNFFHTVGLSGGVSTDISVAFLLNLGFGSAGLLKAAKGNHCLFKLAKRQAYSTHFISIQSSEQLRYISPYLCAASLDEYQGMEEVSPQTKDHQAASDLDLLPALEKLMKDNTRRFVILHQRGSHGPWKLRSSARSKVFSGKTIKSGRIADYDNSVVEFDAFWRKLHGLLEETKKKTLVVYVSDHGEAVGERNRWGHGFIEPLAFEIPVLLSSYNAGLPSEVSRIPNFVTHYNIGLLLADVLGFKANVNFWERPSDYEIYGNDIDGFAGKAVIKFTDQSYTFKFIP